MIWRACSHEVATVSTRAVVMRIFTRMVLLALPYTITMTISGLLATIYLL